MISAPPPPAPSPSALGLGQGLAHTGPRQGAGHVSGFGDRGTRWARGRDWSHVAEGSGWGGRGDTPRSPIRKHPPVSRDGAFWEAGTRRAWGHAHPSRPPEHPGMAWLDANAFQTPRLLPSTNPSKGAPILPP